MNTDWGTILLLYGLLAAFFGSALLSHLLIRDKSLRILTLPLGELVRRLRDRRIRPRSLP